MNKDDWKKTFYIRRLFLWLFFIVIIAPVLFGPIVFSRVFHVIPTKRTHFSNHQEYVDYIGKDSFWAEQFCLRELPADAHDIKYYWYDHSSLKRCAYSMLLAEASYGETIEHQIPNYVWDWEEEGIYEYQEKNGLRILDSEWYPTDLKYLNKIFREPQKPEQYRFYVLTKFSEGNRIHYNGVVGNDTTHELIEFSMEASPSYFAKDAEDRDWGLANQLAALVGIAVFCAIFFGVFYLWRKYIIFRDKVCE